MSSGHAHEPIYRRVIEHTFRIEHTCDALSARRLQSHSLTHTHQRNASSFFVWRWRLEKRKQSPNGRRQRCWWCLDRCSLLKRSCEVVAIVKLSDARFTHIKVLKIIILLLLFLWVSSSSSSRHVATCSLLYYLLNNLWIAIKKQHCGESGLNEPIIYKKWAYISSRSTCTRWVSGALYQIRYIRAECGYIYVVFFLFFFFVSSIKSNNRAHHWVFSCSFVRRFTLSWIIISYFFASAAFFFLHLRLVLHCLIVSCYNSRFTLTHPFHLLFTFIHYNVESQANAIFFIFFFSSWIGLRNSISSYHQRHCVVRKHFRHTQAAQINRK